VKSRMRLLASALALGILSGTACAQTPPAPVTVNIEGRSIRLVVPAGHCALDQNQEIDRQVLDLTARAIGQNDLLLYTTDCRSLTDMRARRLNVLADFSQVQITKALRTVDLAGQETRSIQQVCNELRTNNDLAKRVDQEIKDRIRDLQQNIAINETRSLGVLGEDSTACYSGALITVSDTNGTRLVIGIYAITVLNGRMMFLYRFNSSPTEGALQRLLDLQRTAVRDHLAANPATPAPAQNAPAQTSPPPAAGTPATAPAADTAAPQQKKRVRLY
jgi:hypothetical protein